MQALEGKHRVFSGHHCFQYKAKDHTAAEMGFYLPFRRRHGPQAQAGTQGPLSQLPSLSSSPTASFWGNKHICQPKNHQEFAFSTGGFRRCQGRPAPGVTAAPRSQGGGAHEGKQVGAEATNSRRAVPPPRSQLMG